MSIFTFMKIDYEKRIGFFGGVTIMLRNRKSYRIKPLHNFLY
jgi:hypothetical protein